MMYYMFAFGVVLVTVLFWAFWKKDPRCPKCQSRNWHKEESGGIWWQCGTCHKMFNSLMEL